MKLKKNLLSALGHRTDVRKEKLHPLVEKYRRINS